MRAHSDLHAAPVARYGAPGAVEAPHVDLAHVILENEIGDSVVVQVGACDEPPVAQAAGVEEIRAGLQAAAGGEIDRAAGAVEEPRVELARAILKNEVALAVAVQILR